MIVLSRFTCDIQAQLYPDMVLAASLFQTTNCVDEAGV